MLPGRPRDRGVGLDAYDVLAGLLVVQSATGVRIDDARYGGATARSSSRLPWCRRGQVASWRGSDGSGRESPSVGATQPAATGPVEARNSAWG